DVDLPTGGEECPFLEIGATETPCGHQESGNYVSRRFGVCRLPSAQLEIGIPHETVAARDPPTAGGILSPAQPGEGSSEMRRMIGVDGVTAGLLLPQLSDERRRHDRLGTHAVGSATQNVHHSHVTPAGCKRDRAHSAARWAPRCAGRTSHRRPWHGTTRAPKPSLNRWSPKAGESGPAAAVEVP